jgi:2-haloacid dehalogenase
VKSRLDGITFDVFAALFDLKSSLIPGLRRILSEHGSSVAAEDFYKIWRETQLRYSQINTLLSKGHVPFERLTEYSLVYAEKRFGVELAKPERQAMVRGWQELKPFPEVITTLQKVKDLGYRIALLSNGDRLALRELAGRLDVDFDAIFSAEDAGVYKPHPSIYKQAVTRWRSRPARVMHVAGSSTDATGAKCAGLVTAWVNRDGLPQDQLHYQADYVLASLGELLPIVTP